MSNYIKNLVIGLLSFLCLFFGLAFLGYLKDKVQKPQQEKIQTKKILTPQEQAAEDLKFIDAHMTPQEKKEANAEEQQNKKYYAKEEKEAQLAIKADLDKVIVKYNFNNNKFIYYINKDIWNVMNIDEKEDLFDTCVEYSGYKNKKLEKAVLLHRTKIADYANGKILGEYKGNFKIK